MLTRDRRLRKTIRWTMSEDTIHVRIPPSVRGAALTESIDDIVARVLKQRERARRRNDGDLEERAQAINTQYFGSELRWHSIRWVSNMHQRLGSCSTSGTTDGDIRISNAIKHWPVYVVDYVIAHEIAHRKFPNHSAAFWDYLARYPHTERARGFIDGIAFARGDNPDALL
jgi:predicted metal-dependent hydrolase